MAFTDSGGGGQTLGQIAQSGTGMQSPSQGPGLLGRIGAGIWHATKMYQGQQTRKLEQQRVQIEQQRANEQSINSGLDILTTAGKQDDPVIRSILGRRAISQLGIGPKSEDAKTLNEIFKSDKGQQFINDNMEAFHKTHPDIPMSAVPGILKEAIGKGTLFDVFKPDKAKEPVYHHDTITAGSGDQYDVTRVEGQPGNVLDTLPLGNIADKRAPTQPSELQQKYQALIDADVEPKIAHGLVSGRYVVRDRPGGEGPGTFDVVSNEFIGAAPPTAVAPEAAASEQPDFTNDAVDPTKAVGFFQHIARIGNNISDYFAGKVPFPKELEARKTLDTLRTQTGTTFQQAAAIGRPADRLIREFQDLAPSADLLETAGSGKQDMRTSFEKTIGFLQSELGQADKAAKMRNTLPRMQQAQQYKNRVQSLLRSYQVLYNNIPGVKDAKRSAARPPLSSFGTK